MDLITVLFWIAVSWVFAKVVLAFLDISQVAKDEENLEKLKIIDDMLHIVEVDKVGEIEYWYDKDDGEFLGQGKTLEEIVEVLKSRFPTHVFLIQGMGAIARETGWKLVTNKDLKSIQIKVQ